MSKKRQVVLIFFILIIISCSKHNSTEDVTRTFMEKYAIASTDDKDAIEDVIKYMDKKWSSLEQAKILNLYYIKAQMYYKLGEKDRALEVMLDEKNENKGIFLASLYIITGNAKKAQDVIDKDFQSLINVFSKKGGKEREEYLDAIASWLYLEKAVLHQNRNIEEILTKKEDEYLNMRLSNLKRNDFLKSLWP